METGLARERQQLATIGASKPLPTNTIVRYRYKPMSDTSSSGIFRTPDNNKRETVCRHCCVPRILCHTRATVVLTNNAQARQNCITRFGLRSIKARFVVFRV